MRLHRWCTLLGALMVLPVLTGCATRTTPIATEPIALPAAWSAPDERGSTTPTPLAAWWSRFDDPLLGELVAQALRHNTSIASARAALRQARALRDVTAASSLPTLDASASAQRSRSGTVEGGSVRAGVDASWEWDIFGGQRSALQASEAGAVASAASLGSARVSVAAEVALQYIALRAAQARSAVARENLAIQQETAQIVQWRHQAGLVSALEAEQASASVAQTSAQLPGLQTSIGQASHALALLTGQPPAALRERLATPQALPQPAGSLALSLPAETLRQRPDVLAAEQQVIAATARRAQADAARRPNLRLSGSIGLNALNLGSLTNSASLVSSLVAGISAPLFDGGAGAAQVQAQQAALEQSQSAWRATVLGALREVEDALLALRSDRERLASWQRAELSASQAALLARQRFASGLVDFQTVLDTQRTQLNAQDSVASTWADIAADHVRLYKALGGGWKPDRLESDTP